MADLPDLDTSVIGFIAFWNALDHGVADIDPTEVLDYAEIETFEQFDNGVQGTLSHNMSGKIRTYRWRVKDDGWFIVWIDRTNQFATQQGDADNLDGYYDIYHWSNPGGNPPALPRTGLSDEINALRQRLSNSGSITFNHADVGYFNYEFDTATRFAVASIQRQSKGGPSVFPGIAYADGTTRFYHAATGAVAELARVEFPDGNTLINRFNSQSFGVGVVDVLTDGHMPNAGEYVEGELDLQSSPRNPSGMASHLTIYSP